MANFTFFGIQIAYRCYRKDDSRERLHRIIASGQKEQSLPEKRAFWKQVVAILTEHAGDFEYGSWDFIRGGKADAEFETWSSEIEGGMATESEELGTEADETRRLSQEINDSRYVIASLLFLIDPDTATDEVIGERCDIPEDDFFNRTTLVNLIDAIPLMNFANVRADAIYVVPGDRRDGLSEVELRESWSHLKPLASA